MVISGFNSGNSGAYTVNISSNGSGTLINSTTIPTGYVYKWVIYNSSGIIIGIEDGEAVFKSKDDACGQSSPHSSRSLTH